jgi:hypothetical protein
VNQHKCNNDALVMKRISELKKMRGKSTQSMAHIHASKAGESCLPPRSVPGHAVLAGAAEQSGETNAAFFMTLAKPLVPAIINDWKLTHCIWQAVERKKLHLSVGEKERAPNGIHSTDGKHCWQESTFMPCECDMLSILGKNS